MKLCITRLGEFQPVSIKPWWRFDYWNWHHSTRPTGIVVHWLYWQFHLVWDRGRV